MIIRNELESDVEAITAVTKAAFENHPHSDRTEQFIIAALRASKVLTVSLVSEVEGRLVCHQFEWIS
jgi:putative acetyltransferase